MELRQLRYFTRVVSAGSITGAAGLLRIAQPALTQQMHNLEEELGVVLLERNVRGVKPTAAGITLYSHALSILGLADNTADLLRLDADRPEGRVRVAMASSTARVAAIPLAERIRTMYPRVTLEILDGPSASIGSLINEGRVDFGITVDQPAVRGLAMYPLFSEALHLVAWPDAPIPPGATSLRTLSSLPIVLPGAPNSIRNRVVQALEQENLGHDFRLEVTSTALVLAAVAAKLGVTVLPWSAVHQELAEGKVVLAPLRHRLFQRDLSLCWLEQSHLTNAAARVKEALVDLFVGFAKEKKWAC